MLFISLFVFRCYAPSTLRAWLQNGVCSMFWFEFIFQIPLSRSDDQDAFTTCCCLIKNIIFYEQSPSSRNNSSESWYDYILPSVLVFCFKGMEDFNNRVQSIWKWCIFFFIALGSHIFQHKLNIRCNGYRKMYVSSSSSLCTFDTKYATM